MAFSLPDHWVWDFWLADDGATYHMFYLHAPMSLGDPQLRHRNARIGHATSTDLTTWQDHGKIFDAGPEGSYDGSATWTGSVVHGADGRWYLYYTGSRFLSPDSNANVETIGLAVSDDLFSWQKLPGPIVVADQRWYETLGTSSWPEEAWRDPWVFKGDNDQTWHMLITARANHGDDAGRGVIGHATSTDMLHWHVAPPLSDIDAGFMHLEVPQIVEVEGTTHLIFCSGSQTLSGRLAGERGGIYSVAAPNPAGPYEIEKATLIVTEELYAGRIARTRSGQSVLIAFDSTQADGHFVGAISDPIPLHVETPADGLPRLVKGAR